MVDFEEQELVKTLEKEFGDEISDYWTPAKHRSVGGAI